MANDTEKKSTTNGTSKTKSTTNSTKKATTSKAKTSNSTKSSQSEAKKTTSAKSGSTTKRKYTKRKTNVVDSAVDNATKNILGEGVTSNKTVNKFLKKISTVVKVMGIALFIVGVVLGLFVGKTICKNDTFELIPGNSSYEVGCDATITLPGVKLVAFGKDISDKVQIELSEGLVRNEDGTFTITNNTDGKTIEKGTYYIIYTTTNFKYKKIKKIRYIYVDDMSEKGDGEPEEESTEIVNDNVIESDEGE